MLVLQLLHDGMARLYGGVLLPVLQRDATIVGSVDAHTRGRPSLLVPKAATGAESAVKPQLGCLSSIVLETVQSSQSLCVFPFCASLAGSRATFT